ncbi:hypothetical protein D3C73_847660 [compost metagenome]
MARLDQTSVVTSQHDDGVVCVAAANRRAAGRSSIAVVSQRVAFDCPLRVQRHTGRNDGKCFACSITYSASICRRIPAYERIPRLDETSDIALHRHACIFIVTVVVCRCRSTCAAVAVISDGMPQFHNGSFVGMTSITIGYIRSTVTYMQ